MPIGNCHMVEAKREISGYFLSSDKFASHVSSLASPSCTTTHLRLFHNEPHHTAAVVQALATNTSVTHLDIFELDPAAALSLAALLTNHPRLSSLAVHHFHDQSAVQNLCNGLASSTSLTHIHVSQLSAAGVLSLSQALSAWTAHPSPSSTTTPPAPSRSTPVPADCSAPRRPLLRRFQLEKCLFNPATASALAEALGRQAATLEQLAFSQCELGSGGSEALLGSPSWSLLAGEQQALRELDLSSCHLSSQGAACLGPFLATHRTLHTLHLANNLGLGCVGAALLASGLSTNRTLRHLDLSGCGIGPAGAQALAKALRPASPRHPLCDTTTTGGADTGYGGVAGSDRSRPPLKHLILSDNAVGAAGLWALLWALTAPTGGCTSALRRLVLDRNHISGRELDLLKSEAAPGSDQTQAVSSEPPGQLPMVAAPLEQLSLAVNALYEVGVRVLVNCLAETPSLELLDFRENGISDGGVAALLPLVAGAQRATGGNSGGGLQGLLLDGNRLHNSGGQVLLEAVMAAPWLWRFSVENNKLTDPALRLSLSQLSQLRAARHSQLVVLGRHYSSDDDDEPDPRNRGGGGDSRGEDEAGNRRRGGPTDPRGSDPMDDDGRSGRGGGGGGAHGEGGDGYHHHQLTQLPVLQQHQQLQNKQRRWPEDAMGADEVGSADERHALSNVAARSSMPLYDGDSGSAQAAAAFGTAGGGGGGVNVVAPGGDLVGVVGAGEQPRVQSGGSSLCLESGGGSGQVDGEEAWRMGGDTPFSPTSCDRASLGGSSDADATISSFYGKDLRGSGGSSAGGSIGGSSRAGGSSGGSSASDGGHDSRAGTTTSSIGLSTSPSTVCYVTAFAGAGPAVIAKRRSATGEHDPRPVAAPVSPAQRQTSSCRRPRYKPLTPEQQRLFEDF